MTGRGQFSSVRKEGRPLPKEEKAVDWRRGGAGGNR